MSEQEKHSRLTPDHELLRELEGVEGEVQVEITYEPRPDYGRRAVKLQPRGRLGLWCDVGRGILSLRSDYPLDIAESNDSAHTVATISAGERKYMALAYDEEGPAVLPSGGGLARTRIEQTARWWQDWAARCRYTGPYRDEVGRSALALKLMAYAPSGAVIAAPTTSLPEALGGVRNWDYRFCWLRDASFTVRALLDLGYDEEAEAFVSWMLHTTRLTWPELQVVYGVFGESQLSERELSNLEGYVGSRPVRIGNAAHDQFQLDVYGEVVDAVARYAEQSGHLDRDTVQFLEGLGQAVCRRWQEPDEGIWEGRSGRFHHTHSKVLCWVALDRLIKMHEAGTVNVPVGEFRRHREAIRQEIEARGYNESLLSYTRTFDGDDVDASLLTLPFYEYIDARHPRMMSTCDKVHERLSRDGLMYRYQWDTDDGLPPGEGTFGVCGFWAVECLARHGDVEGAERAFKRLLSLANDVGLFAEEIDPDTGALLGNFPQAFTHLGVINAALTLAECGSGEATGK